MILYNYAVLGYEHGVVEDEVVNVAVVVASAGEPRFTLVVTEDALLKLAVVGVQEDAEYDITCFVCKLRLLITEQLPPGLRRGEVTAIAPWLLTLPDTPAGLVWCASGVGLAADRLEAELFLSGRYLPGPEYSQGLDALFRKRLKLARSDKAPNKKSKKRAA